MLLRRIPINIPDSCTAKSTATFTRKTNLQNYGKLLRVKCVSVCNQENNNTEVNVGYMRSGMAYYFDTLVLSKHSYFYMSLPDILIPSNYQIVLKFFDHAEGDRYLINITMEEEVYSEESNG